ncbi:MAG: hypothetical protein K4445_01645 [Deltaproteobacteria bacterium]|jgi:hypothetical protein
MDEKTSAAGKRNLRLRGGCFGNFFWNPVGSLNANIDFMRFRQSIM